MQELMLIPLTSVISILVLFALSKMIGYREISQLSVFDYINSITIGSIAAELAHATDEDFWTWLLAMIVYGVFTLLFAIASDRSRKLRKLITGSPIVLMENATLYRKNFKKAHVDTDEFLSACRAQGYFDISELHTVIMEPSGKMSILPKSEYKTISPNDLSIQVPKETLQAILISDGKILPQNLDRIGKTKNWLMNELKIQKISDHHKVFLAVYSDGKLNVFPMNNEKDNVNTLK